MASAPMMFIPQNGANVFTGGQAMPGTVVQPAGTAQYIQYVTQPVRGPTNQPQTALQKVLRAEPKALGAIQIMIGLIHIGFGAISIHIFRFHYWSFTAVSGYPFWGALFFIVSGSLSVSVEKHLNPCMVSCSVGLNITSAVVALTGITLFCVEFAIGQSFFPSFYFYSASMNSVGIGISALLLLFTFLEFCITVLTAHFGCKAACCNNDIEAIVVPYPVSGTNVAPDQGNPAYPPAYNSATDSPK